MEKKFRKGEIVWAKVKGFPWWPGKIDSVSLKNKQTAREDLNKSSDYFYSIDFFGDNSHIELPSDKVENFNDNYILYSKTRQKRLLKSIELAKKLVKIQQNNNSFSNGVYPSSTIKNKTVIISENDIQNNFLGKKTQRNLSPSQAQLRDINISININVTNNHHNTLNFHPFSNLTKEKMMPSMVNALNDLNQQIINKKEEEGKDDNKKGKEEEKEEEEEDEEMEEETPEDKLKQSIDSFLRYQIENSSSKRTPFLLKSIEEIENNLKKISSSTYSVRI